jgi:tetratricopeptide (TPR) repeat protein
VTWTLFGIQWRLWGASPAGFRAVNLLLHAACAAALWRVMVRLRIPGSWLAALIFALHPVNVETAAWITQQKNLVSLLLGTLAALALLDWEGSRRRALYVLSVSAFAAACLSKTAAVTLPAVYYGCLWWRRRRLDARDLLAVVPHAVLSLCFAAGEVYFHYFGAVVKAGEVRTDSLAARIATAGHVVFFYLGKVLAPLNLCFVYDLPRPDPPSASSFGATLLVLALLAVFFAARNGWGRPLLFAFGAYVAMLLPVLGFLNIYFMRYSPVSDHWQYLAIVFPIAACVGLLSRAVRVHAARLRPLAWTAAALACGLLALQSRRRVQVFRTPEALWRDTLAKNPAAMLALNNYGRLLLDRQRFDEAVTMLRRGLAEHPDSDLVRLNLALALAGAGREAEAERHLRAIVTATPGHGHAWYELGRLAVARGRPAEARACFETVLRLDPRHVRARVAMALLAIREGRAEEGEALLREAAAADSGDAEAAYLLARRLLATDRGQEAERFLKRAIGIDGCHVAARKALGVRYAETGRLEQAVREFRHVLALRPDDAAARANLQLALRQASAARDN